MIEVKTISDGVPSITVNYYHHRQLLRREARRAWRSIRGHTRAWRSTAGMEERHLLNSSVKFLFEGALWHL